MSAGKLIVASVRLPVTLTRKAEAWEARPSTGGLVTALKSVSERRAFTWLGWAGTSVPETERATVTRVLSPYGAAPVFLSKAEIEGFYEGFSNQVLWPLFHALPGRVHFSQSSWKTYQRVNEAFARAIAERASPNDLVWIHDYQLALLPEMLRRLGVNLPIGFFLHIPFPSAEIYRTLPAREEILRGMLGADLLGFHAYEYVSHFRSACLRVLGLESEPDELRLPSRRVHFGVLPIGIDPAEIDEMARSSEARNELAAVRASYPDKKIIIGVDRLDYTKGIPEKLLAFEELLRAHPKWRSRAVLIQVAAPSRENVDEYKQLKRDVDELVGRINGRFGTASNTPIAYINQSVPRNRLVGLYQAAEIGLITPVRDGMNLVALEYVAARKQAGGTLVLSEFAGAAHLLAGARLVSPYDTSQVANTLADALDTEPSPESFAHMLDFISQNTSVAWANRFLDRLESIHDDARPKILRLHVESASILEKLAGAENPLVLLDYDGTLRKFEAKPSDAVPTERILSILKGLCEVATVYIVSGRPGAVLDGWFGHLPAGLVCEHGFAVRSPGGQWIERKVVPATTFWKKIERVLEEFVRRTPGSRIERKKAAIAWHYRGADPEWGIFQAGELYSLLEDMVRRGPFSVLRGAKVLEVRHESVTKGHATVELLKQYAEADALFCAGDDRTDEEMMEAISRSWRARAVTCWVGGRNAAADYWVDSAHELLEELGGLIELWRSSAERRRKKRARARA